MVGAVKGYPMAVYPGHFVDRRKDLKAVFSCLEIVSFSVLLVSFGMKVLRVRPTSTHLTSPTTQKARINNRALVLLYLNRLTNNLIFKAVCALGESCRKRHVLEGNEIFILELR
jgi:hypothetical protein